MSYIGPGTWRENALGRIAAIHRDMPEGATAEELRAELRRHSGDFHGGTSWGKKVWPKACAEYIKRHFGVVAAMKTCRSVKRVEDSPLFSSADHAFPFRDHSTRR